MLFLTNLMSGPEAEFKMGWAMIVVIGLMFVANLLLMLAVNITNICRRAYLYFLRSKRRKDYIKNGGPVEAVFMQSSSPQEADELEVISERDEESNASLRVVQ